MIECAFDGCRRPAKKKSLCGSHYNQQWRGDPLIPLPPMGLTPQGRFWSKVRKTAGCWTWTDYTSRDGYGRMAIAKRMVLAHRFSFELANGPIPEGLFLDHMCHNRACVNPAHLRTVTNKQNTENVLRARRGAESGVLGVHRNRKGWQGRVVHHGQTHRAGTYRTIEEAAEAVKALRLSLFTHNDLDRGTTKIQETD